MRFRICIVTPGALGSNPRVVKEAEALHDNGYEVTVISTRTHPQLDCHDDPVMATAQWRTLRLDFRSRGTIWQMRRAAQLGHRYAFNKTNCRALADRAFSPLTGPLLAAAKRLPADLYVAHYPAALPAAAVAARRHHTSYAYDAEDFHLGDGPEDPAEENNRSLIRAIEERYLPDCAYLTAASPGIANAYVAAYGVAHPAVVLNTFPRAHAPIGTTAAGTVEPKPSVYWFSQTIGPDRGLECALHAIARADTRPHLYLRGSPAAGFLDRLRAIAASVGAEDRLHVMPPAAPNDMAILAASYDVGLCSESGHSHNRRIALGNKVFTYLLAGLPVVMSDIPSHEALAHELGAASYLYPREDAERLASTLDTLLGDPAALATARAAAFRLGQTRFNWDVEKESFLALVEVFRRRTKATLRYRRPRSKQQLLG